VSANRPGMRAACPRGLGRAASWPACCVLCMFQPVGLPSRHGRAASTASPASPVAGRAYPRRLGYGGRYRPAPGLRIWRG
jgi:hypothetical protein